MNKPKKATTMEVKSLEQVKREDAPLYRAVHGIIKSAFLLMISFIAAADAMSIAAPKTNEIENSSFLYHQHPHFAAGVDNLSLLLGEPTTLLSRTDDGNWQPMQTVSPKHFAFQHPVDLCWVYPTNDSTQWLGTEDHTWHRAPKSLPRNVETFIHQVVAEKHGKLVDIMEIYSPPRVTKEARKQNAQGRQPQLRLGQALDLRTGWDFTKRAHRREAIKLVKM